MSVHFDEAAVPRDRLACLIICSEFEDARVAALPEIPADTSRLSKVLSDPKIGAWSVTQLVNPTTSEVLDAIDRLGRAADPKTSLLLYLATHVIVDDHGEIYFAFRDTNMDRLDATARAARDLVDPPTARAADSVLLLLDSPAWKESSRSRVGDGLGWLNEGYFGPRTVVLSSARDIEDDRAVPVGWFTRGVVDGLATGAADVDEDGRVSVDDLYGHLRDTARAVAARPPGMSSAGPHDRVLVGFSPHAARPSPVAPPPSPEPEPEPTPPRRLRSPSVKALEADLTGAVTASVVVRHLLARHSDYAAGQEPRPALPSGDGERKPVADWLVDVEGLLRTERPTVLHGRLVVCVLALLDDELGAALSRDGFLRRLESEVAESLGDLLTPEARKAWERPDTVPTLSDRPSDVDLLGRKAFAEALGARIEDELVESASRRDTRNGNGEGSRGRDASGEAFIVHLYGPWGSGKTSLLNLLSDYLRKRDEPWVVVRFNAWQFERIGPPWWGLMQAALQEGVRDPFGRGWWRSLDRGRARRIMRSLRLGLLDLAWRVRLAWTAYLLLPALIALVWWAGNKGWIELDIRKLDDIGATAKAIAAILTLIVTVIGAARGLHRAISVSSARGANAFMASSHDPMRTLKRRFHRLICSLGRPVAIFIDDLDRCQAQYVVDVLQGVQTLLLDEPVTYVIAADRRWLYESYAKVYRDFRRASQDPGRPLGDLFLEKTFQLSAPLPRLSAEVQRAYWHQLIALGNGHHDGEAIREIERDAVEKLSHATSESEVRQLVEQSEGQSPAAQIAVRSAAVRRLADRKLRERTEHTLKAFSHLLEPNPRSMKRLVNAYGIQRDLRLLEHGAAGARTSSAEHLALWTIVRLRWPVLADYLAADPARIESSAWPQEAHALKSLFDSSDVRDVINGRGVGVGLTIDALRVLEGQSTRDPASAQTSA